MSDDAGRLLLQRSTRIFVFDTAAVTERCLADGIASAILSGNGRVVWAVANDARLLKIDGIPVPPPKSSAARPISASTRALSIPAPSPRFPPSAFGSDVTRPVIAEAAGEHSPFDFPESSVRVWSRTRTGTDWSPPPVPRTPAKCASQLIVLPGSALDPDCGTARRSGSGMLAIGARGATQVRGKDGVHPEIVGPGSS